jgi:hypothetical protein
MGELNPSGLSGGSVRLVPFFFRTIGLPFWKVFEFQRASRVMEARWRVGKYEDAITSSLPTWRTCFNARLAGGCRLSQVEKLEIGGPTPAGIALSISASFFFFQAEGRRVLLQARGWSTLRGSCRSRRYLGSRRSP